MEIPATEFIELSRRLQKLESEIISIRSLLNQKGISSQPNLNESNGTQEQEVLAQLFEEGIWRKATDDEKKLANAWRNLPDAEKESVISELENLKLEPSLSEIINLNRAGRDSL